MWDKAFWKIDHSMLIDLATAANCLEISTLLDVTREKVAKKSLLAKTVPKHPNLNLLTQSDSSCS
ncbi:hypothetical protein F2Q70_00044185 [Brassica cretica]|uniref:Uncharacterized protein n=1 Tax=Brassica cretica TaxID=69181 RepID=A0A8S9KKF5_BRACR|nr:hypothetical protein F2Q70_00044185 [Brassica cretica]